MTVKVKPLVWELRDDCKAHREYARTPYGSVYHVSEEGWWHVLGPINRYPSLVVAKAAAQADYEARIRAAIEAPAQEPTCWLPTATVEWLMGYDGPACATTTAAHNRPIKSDGGVPLYTTPPDHLALVAAAYRDAAACCEDYPRAAPEESEWTRYDEQIAHSKSCILDRTPADAEAHLTALLRAAYERGVRESAAVSRGRGFPDGFSLPDHPFDRGYQRGVYECTKHILALLTQEGR